METQSTGTGASQGRSAPTALLVNNRSRSGQEAFERIAGVLRELGTPLVIAEARDEAAALTRLARSAVKQGVKRIVVGGGDGTLSCVSSELVGTDAVLAVLPLGTGNDFARSLRIPADPEAACHVILDGQVRSIDVGVANGRAFLNAASVGLSSEITRRLSPDLKRRMGRAAFAVAAAGGAWSHEPFGATLEFDGGEAETLDAHQIVIGNGRYHGGGRMVAPDASHSDHLLDVYVIRSARAEGNGAAGGDEPEGRGRVKDLWTLFRVATLLGRGRHVDHPAVLHRRATRVRLVTEPPHDVDLDGELLGRTPVEFGVRPSGLNVLVPRRE